MNNFTLPVTQNSINQHSKLGVNEKACSSVTLTTRITKHWTRIHFPTGAYSMAENDAVANTFLFYCFFVFISNNFKDWYPFQPLEAIIPNHWASFARWTGHWDRLEHYGETLKIDIEWRQKLRRSPVGEGGESEPGRAAWPVSASCMLRRQPQASLQQNNRLWMKVSPKKPVTHTSDDYTWGDIDFL